MHEVRIHSGFIEQFHGAGWSGMQGKEDRGIFYAGERDWRLG
jgi:hypothetical protein